MRATVLLAALAILLAQASQAAEALRVETGPGSDDASPEFKRPALPFFAFCMDTHDAKKRTVEEQTGLLKELGYAGLGHLWLDQLPERIKAVDAAGLQLFQVYLSVRLDAPDKPAYDPRLKEMLPLLKGRGTMLALLVGGGKPSDPQLDPAAARLVNEIADLALPQGSKVVLYPHVGDWLERTDDAVRVARRVNRPGVGVMFNLCHFLKAEEESRLGTVLGNALPHLLAVSINGSDRGETIRAGKGQWIAPLDTGDFDLAGFLRLLRERGYTGPVGLQCYGIAGDARDHLTRSMAAWRRLTQP